MDVGLLSVACDWNMQGVNPSVRSGLELRSGSDAWHSSAEVICGETVERSIGSATTARVRVFVGGGVCACEYSVTFTFTPDSA